MVNSWRKYAAETYKVEQRFVNLIERNLRTQIQSFIDHLKQYGAPYATSHLTLTTWNQELLPIIQQIHKIAGLAGAKRAHGEIKEQIREGRKFTGLGRNESWIKEVLNYMRLHLLNKSVIPITQTTKDNILKTMDEAVKEGWSFDQITERLTDIEHIRARARTIARTEVIRASNVGHKIGASTSPYEVEKKWMSAKDHRTRHSHKNINGQTVSENGTFEVDVYKGKVKIGTEPMQFPGDPDASAANTINCRCRQIYLPKRDERGRLILRNQTTPTPAKPQLQDLLRDILADF